MKYLFTLLALFCLAATSDAGPLRRGFVGPLPGRPLIGRVLHPFARRHHASAPQACGPVATAPAPTSAPLVPRAQAGGGCASGVCR